MHRSARSRLPFVAVLIGQLFAVSSHAQRTPLACQVEVSGGLTWESGRWVLSRFHEKKFVLVQEGQSLTADSAAKAVGGSSASCETLYGGRISCTDGLGGYLLFDPRSKRGTVAQLLGGTTASTAQRDTLHVEPFFCQAF